MIQDLRIRQSKIFEKLARDRRGRLFRVRFVVVERDRVLRGKIVFCEEVRTLRTPHKVRKYEQKQYYLGASTSSFTVKDKGLRIADSYVSPYFNALDFFVSQMTRAPSGAI